jgi:DNA polymerase-3 subunit epsilon
MEKYSIIDIETTGGNRDGHKITEIAIINVDGDQVVEEFSTLINPERSIPYPITRLTGISDDMVVNAPKFYEVAKKIVQMTEGRIFVAHNVFFDFNFIKSEFAELGFQFKREKLCTVRLARKHIPGHASYSLGKICNDLGIVIDGRHRAMGDAKATVILFQMIQNKIQDTDLIQEESKKVSLPPKLERENFDSLPNTIGVYYFYDEEGSLLYIGKSKDIKKRVTSHFRVDLKRKKDVALKSKIARIDYKELPHELAALLYECSEIKKHYPPYNVALKRLRFPVALELRENLEGILEIRQTQNDEFSNHVHTFRNKRAAKAKINAFYKSITGHEVDSLHFAQKNQLLIRTLGIEKYNELVSKTFNKNVPQGNDFTLQLGRTCLLEVVDKRPHEITITDREGEILETISFKPDQDLFNIMLNY